MSSRLAIAPQFDIPLPQTSASQPASPKAAQGDERAPTASGVRSEWAPSEFAQLIHQITNESAYKAPVSTAGSRPSPVRTQPAALIQGKPALETAQGPTQPTTAVAAPTPVTAMLTEFNVDDVQAPGKPPRRLVGQKADEPAPEMEAAVTQKEDAQSMVASGQVQRPQKPAPAKATQEATPPSIAVNIPVPVPVPIKLKLPSFAAPPNEAMQTESGVLPAAPVKREQAPDLVPAAALELRIRAQDQPDGAPAALKPAQSGDEPADPAAEMTLAQYRQQDTRAEQVLIHATASLPGGSVMAPSPVQPVPTTAVTAAATPQAPPIGESSGAKPQQPISPTAQFEEPLVDEPRPQTQSLRSISIEFTPDGAQDVRLRLEERAGDVHISLHSTDPVLTGRLSDGVHDLVGTLANAGYDAQAWTPDQGRQNPRQSEDPRRNRRSNPAEEGAEEFGAVMQQPIENNP